LINRTSLFQFVGVRENIFGGFIMEKVCHFVGIDVSSETLDLAIYRGKNVSVSSKEPFSNDIEGYEKAEQWLQNEGVDKSNAVVCLEITGVYSEEVCYYLHEKGYVVWAEAPHKVNRAFRSQIKNDTVSAIQIAEYCFRYLDLLIPFEPNLSIIDEVQTLLTTREQLVGQCTANKNVLGAVSRKRYKSNIALAALESAIQNLAISIKDIDKELKKLIFNNSKYTKKAQALDSIPGIALLFVANFFVISKAFKNEIPYKKLASYIGICPNEFKSGTSVFRKPKSSGFGNERFRKLLFLASMSVRQHNPKFFNYFTLKEKAGKNDELILNNIANKLLKIVCSIAKSGLLFNPSFESVHPKFLKVI
jgi:transposase